MHFTPFAASSNRGNATPRGRGRGARGGPSSGHNSGTNTPSRGRGRGYDSPRGGRGRPHDGIGASPRGRGAGPMRPTVTLSGLLYQERPLLRPIVFVPSVLTKVLFQDEEELLQPGVEDVGECLICYSVIRFSYQNSIRRNRTKPCPYCRSGLPCLYCR